MRHYEYVPYLPNVKYDCDDTMLKLLGNYTKLFTNKLNDNLTVTSHLLDGKMSLPNGIQFWILVLESSDQRYHLKSKIIWEKKQQFIINREKTGKKKKSKLWKQLPACAHSWTQENHHTA